MKKFAFVLIGVAGLLAAVTGCSGCGSKSDTTAGGENEVEVEAEVYPVCEVPDSAVTVVETDGLKMYFPLYSKVDLVCSATPPSPEDKKVILTAAGAFTQATLDEFKHSNIVGNHVADGIFYNGPDSKRCQGMFAFYDGTPRIAYKADSLFTRAAERGGCAFIQEMVVFGGKEIPHTRPNSNVNQFRALCMVDGELAFIESKKSEEFGQFITQLLDAGVTEALYLDMGGWDYSWYRDEDGNAVVTHPNKTKYATNFITFYN